MNKIQKQKTLNDYIPKSVRMAYMQDINSALANKDISQGLTECLKSIVDEFGNLDVAAKLLGADGGSLFVFMCGRQLDFLIKISDAMGWEVMIKTRRKNEQRAREKD